MRLNRSDFPRVNLSAWICLWKLILSRFNIHCPSALLMRTKSQLFPEQTSHRLLHSFLNSNPLKSVFQPGGHMVPRERGEGLTWVYSMQGQLLLEMTKAPIPISFTPPFYLCLSTAYRLLQFISISMCRVVPLQSKSHKEQCLTMAGVCRQLVSQGYLSWIK